MSKNGNAAAFEEFHAFRIAGHYHKAVSKHRYFADHVFAPERVKTDGGPEGHLAGVRKQIEQKKKKHELDFVHLADCELAEMYVEFCKGDTVRAVDECYDMIAIMLRAIDTLEGRQKRGKIKKAVLDGK